MNDLSTSGFLVDSFEGVNDHFTSFEALGTHSHNRLARAKRYGRWYLLKGLGDEETGQQAYHEMLAKEFDIMMRLQHPGVVQAVNFEDVPGMGKCIVMEWVEGVNLAEWLKTSPSRDERRDVARQLMEALAYIHRHGVVHRDIKPTNVMVTSGGQQVKIIDFGLADTHMHATLKQPAGTARYMAPEQASEAAPDPRNDIYSLGVILKDMNLGRNYDSVVKRCLLPINERFQTVDELIAAIAAGKKRRYRLQIATYAIGLALAVSGILLGLGYYGRQKLENPSGNYQFSFGAFVYTNWNGAQSDAVSAQYIGDVESHVFVRQHVINKGITWSVSELGFGCFRDAAKLEHLTIEQPYFGIQKHSFKGCTNLKSISMPNIEKPPCIGNGGWQTVIDSVFEPYHFERVTIYVPIVEEMKADSSWSRFKHIEPYRKNTN